MCNFSEHIDKLVIGEELTLALSYKTRRSLQKLPQKIKMIFEFS